MRRLLGILCVLAACTFSSTNTSAKVASKSPAPEKLLPANSLIYLRYDGYEPHRSAYDRTALGRLMKEDLGDFFEHIWSELRDLAVASSAGETPDMDRQKKLRKGKDVTDKLRAYLWQHGVAMTFEYLSLENGGAPQQRKTDAPPVPRRKKATSARTFPGELFSAAITKKSWARCRRLARQRLLSLLTTCLDDAAPASDDADLPVRLTVVFPEGGTQPHRENIQGVFHLAAELAEAKVRTRQYQGRTISELGEGKSYMAWWVEGPHLVLVAGRDPVAATLAVIDGRRPNLTSHPLLQSLNRFHDYETDIRGFVDVRSIVEWAGAPAHGDSWLTGLTEKLLRSFLLREIGLTGVKGLTFHMGFEKQFQRSTVAVETAQPKWRTGLLRLVSGPLDFRTEQMPPMPPDVSTIGVYHLDWRELDRLLRHYVHLYEVSAALSEGRWPKAIDLEKLIGFDIRKELLDHLEPTVLTYAANSEGPWICGWTVAVKVKDEAKILGGMARLGRFLRSVDKTYAKLEFQKRTYRGKDFYVLNGYPSLPVTVSVHKGWLIMGMLPQPVMGWLLRSDGKYKAWSWPAWTRDVIRTRKGSRLINMSMNDPRPYLDFGLSWLPTLASIIKAADDEGSFDISKIPHPQAMSDELFPNLSATYDDGDALRWESYFSVDMPISYWWLVGSVIAGEIIDFDPISYLSNIPGIMRAFGGK
jgi:hypothetical protein